ACEEEHAGGALVFPSFDLGERFSGEHNVQPNGYSYAEMLNLFRAALDSKPEGWAVDKKFPDIIYVPEDARFDLHQQSISWAAGKRTIKLLPGRTYVLPSGYQVRMEKPPGNRAWRLIGIVPDATLCHKPCTVSGG